jgi:hypothetical protein
MTLKKKYNVQKTASRMSKKELNQRINDLLDLGEYEEARILAEIYLRRYRNV